MLFLQKRLYKIENVFYYKWEREGMHVRARQVTCSFTGHRPEKLPWGEDESDIRCAQLKERLFDAVLAAYDQGYRHFLCGMASVRRIAGAGGIGPVISGS